MSTIYDVAKKAGVSISTVSNFLNNKYIGPERRNAIKAAIADLDYVPSQSAKRLKTKKSNQVAIILPNIEERLFSETLTGIDITLKANGYTPVLYLTDDNTSSENTALSACLTSEYAGIMICTCNATNTPLFTKLQKRLPLTFILRKPKHAQMFNTYTFNEEKTIYQIAQYFLQHNHTYTALLTGPLAFLNEQACVNGFKLAYKENTNSVKPKIISLPSSPADIFKHIMRLLADDVPPKLLITTSSKVAQALAEAAELRNLCLGSDINILSLGEDSWYNQDNRVHMTTTNRPAKELGMKATQTLVAHINSKKTFETVNKTLADKFNYARLKKISDNLKRFTSTASKPIYASTLNILLRKNDNISDTIKYVLPQFEKQAKVNVSVTTLSQTDIYNELMKVKNSKQCTYDVFAIDVPWLAYFAQNDCLMDITKSFESIALSTAFSQNTLDRFGKVGQKLYAIPYLNATQLLFYRKDLFQDDANKRAFYTTYERPLVPPTTWFDYNLIARFFTKKYNPKSPTQFGTSITRGFHEALMGELYPRMWAYGGAVFDNHGRITVYSEENIAAYKSMAEALRYCDPTLAKVGGYEKTIRFAKGENAMIVAYHHYASALSDRSISKIADHIGFSLIPGLTPVLAGWSMGINSVSPQTKTATAFLHWLVNIQSSISYTVLCGNSARESTYYNPDLLKLYPWFNLVPQSTKLAKPRNTPLISGEVLVTEAQVEKILANVIYQHFAKRTSIETLLKQAHDEIRQQFLLSGYAEPSIF